MIRYNNKNIKNVDINGSRGTNSQWDRRVKGL